jgi:aminoglycoside phosphotransferase (APT) family kinase protein
VLDWQSVALGPAAVDLALLLVGSMTTIARRAHERILLGEYWRLIVEQGVTGYSQADLWRDYSRSIMWLLAGTVGWLAMVDPASTSGRERLILERQISEPRVFEAALDRAT